MLLNFGIGEDSWESVGWRSNQSILKEISPEYSLEGLMLKLKLQYFGHLIRRTDSLEKTLMLGKIESRRRMGQQDEMVGWHHWLNGRKFKQTLGVGYGQGSLACCSPWGCKDSDTTERMNWTEHLILLLCFYGSGLVGKSCPTLATPWTVACQAPLSMGFSRQEYWSGLPFPSPGNLPNPRIKPRSPALQADSLPTELQGKPLCFHGAQ